MSEKYELCPIGWPINTDAEFDTPAEAIHHAQTEHKYMDYFYVVVGPDDQFVAIICQGEVWGRV